MTKEVINLANKVLNDYDLENAAVLAFMAVETGGQGFNPANGKLIIQFEPIWFRRNAPYAPSGLWSLNKVDVQTKEWLAFNDAFAKNPNAAMESTSIGIGQILGLHYERLGFKSVGAMWDDAKISLENQIRQLVKFILTDIKLRSCLKAHDWDGVATIFNGSGFRQLAIKYNRVPYDISMSIEYARYKF